MLAAMNLFNIVSYFVTFKGLTASVVHMLKCREKVVPFVIEGLNLFVYIWF